MRYGKVPPKVGKTIQSLTEVYKLAIHGVNIGIIIINCLKNWYEKLLMEQQLVSRFGRGTRDGIYKMVKPDYALFIVELAAD